MQVLDLCGPVPVELPFGATTINEADAPLVLGSTEAGSCITFPELSIGERRASRCVEQNAPERMAEPQSRGPEPLLSSLAREPWSKEVVPLSLLVDPRHVGLYTNHNTATRLQVAPEGTADQTAIHVV